MKRSAVLFLLASGVLCGASAEGMKFGFGLEADAGVAPLVFLNQDSAGFRLLFPLPGDWAVESSTSAGYCILLVGYYPPPAMAKVQNWFRVGQRVGLSYPLVLSGSADSGTALRLHPLELSVSWVPLHMVIAGAGTGIDLELAYPSGFVWRPIGVFANFYMRPTELGYPWFFQAGLRMAFLW